MLGSKNMMILCLEEKDCNISGACSSNIISKFSCFSGKYSILSVSWVCTCVREYKNPLPAYQFCIVFASMHGTHCITSSAIKLLLHTRIFYCS